MVVCMAFGFHNRKVLVLKTQLHSKLNLSNLCRWRDSEDILTGDFFGVLDYLPRQPYLQDFLQLVEDVNPGGMHSGLCAQLS